LSVWTVGTPHTSIPLRHDPRRGSRGISDIPSRRPRFTQINDSAMRNTSDVTGSLVAYYDIRGRKGEGYCT
jgi:hypothetical protein